MTPDRWQKRQDAKRFKQVTGVKETKITRLRLTISNMKTEMLVYAMDHGFMNNTLVEDERIIKLLKEEYVGRFVTLFRKEHDLTDAEFKIDHWQCLFAIQYPEAAA